jgi:hypothetical protein
MALQLLRTLMSALSPKALRCNANTHTRHGEGESCRQLQLIEKVERMAWKEMVVLPHLMPECLNERSIGQFTPVR